MVACSRCPEVYIVAQGVVICKPGKEPTARDLTKVALPAGTLVFSTGQAWRDQAILWAELKACKAKDNVASGWILVEGPGFGLQGPLLVSDRDSTKLVKIDVTADSKAIAHFMLPIFMSIGQLKTMIAVQTGLATDAIELTKERGIHVSGGQIARREALQNVCSLKECNIEGPLSIVYNGDFCEDYKPTIDFSNTWDVPHWLRVAAGLISEGEVEATPTAGDCSFKVLADFVSVRSKPSMLAPKRGGLSLGDVVFGTPCVTDGEPWLRIGKSSKPSWVLIHGACIGLGQLLCVIKEPPNLHRQAGKTESQDELLAEIDRAIALEARQQQPHLAETNTAISGSPYPVSTHVDVLGQEKTAAQEQSAAIQIQSQVPEKAEPDAPESDSPTTWGTDQVLRFAKALGISQGLDDLAENAVDGMLLSTLSEDDLVTELGFKRLQAKKLLLRFKEACRPENRQSTHIQELLLQTFATG